MTQSGFFFDRLTDFQKDMMKLAEDTFPKETKKFLKKEGQKLTKLQKQIAKKDVGTSKGKKGWQEEKSYHKRFKTGSIFEGKYGDKCVKSYNNARHAHLIEFGHKTKNGKYVHGKYVMAVSRNEFNHTFSDDCEEFLDEVFKFK